ncbi:alpha/beta hydrolase family protein [Catellatospora vulcania]|uniref:hypothetical protein n=1 Tax=Catellatospora vulcania TaxID=1460450 RepID=UPI0012D45694|nr:hypothetical protein [Catellatospora vulcania]
MALDGSTFAQTVYADDVVASNAAMGAMVREMGWPPQSVQAFRDQARERLAALAPGGVLPRSPLAREITVPLPAGSMSARVFDAPTPTGLYLHVHGGGWTVGAADEQDSYLEDLVRGTEDPLLDDSLFLYARLLAARSPAQIQVVPGAGHSFNLMPLSVSGPANEVVYGFLAAALAA